MHQSDMGRRKFLTLSGAAVAGAMGLTLSGCGKDETSLTKASAGSGPLIKAAGSENGSSGVMRQALKLAVDELGGARVELANMAQGTALLSMHNGSVQSAMMSWVNLGQARDNGVKAVAIAPAWASHASVLVPSDSPVGTLQDLKGKKVGSSERTTGVYTETRSALKEQGIDIEKDFRLQPMGDSAVLQALFLKGDFDALVTSEPTASQLLVGGQAKELLQVGTYTAQEQGAYVPVNSWGVRQDWLDENDAKSLQAIFKRASELASTSKEPYELAGEVTGMSGDETNKFFERFSQLVVTAFTDQSLEQAQLQLDEGHEQGLMKSAYQVTDLVLKA